MKAALLIDRGVVKVAGEDARKFLNGLVTVDMGRIGPGQARFAALLTPQGKIIADFIIAEALPAGGGFFLDCPRSLAPTLTGRLNFYKLRAKVIVEDLSETLGVMAIWGGAGKARFGLCYPDPRLNDLGERCMLAPHLAEKAAAEFGATLVDATDYDAYRISLGVPKGDADFAYADAYPHETDMDQLNGVDFDKGCFVGQEVVSRIEHRNSARTRIVPVAFEGAQPTAGTAVMGGDCNVGTIGSAIAGRGLATLRLDRVEAALASGTKLTASGIEIKPVKPGWARFVFPGETKAAE